MSEKTEVDQEYDEQEDVMKLTRTLPEHQYSREELITISKSSVSSQRHKCLDQAYDSEDGRWDPERWYRVKFGQSREVSPIPLGDGKDRRRLIDPDRDQTRKPSLNDPVERLKEERDGIVLSPQRRSFGTGCHVQTTVYTRQLSIPDRDRERDDQRSDRDRERPVRKIGSGRIQIDRDNSRDFSTLWDRDRFDERDIRDRDQDRERDFAWSRDRERDREREWDRDVRDRDIRDRDLRERDVRDRDPRDIEWDRDRDRRFDRSDRFRRVGDRDFPERDRRDRDFRDRGFERNNRRRNNYRDEEKEPEWFTGGPVSQMDTIELRGFERETSCEADETSERKTNLKNEQKKSTSPSDEKSSKESSEETSEVDMKVSQCSTPEEDGQMVPNEQQEHTDAPNQNEQEEPRIITPQQNSALSPSNKLFDFDEILKAQILPLDDDFIFHGSRFSRFFSGPGGNIPGSDASSTEDMLVPRDLLDDSRTSPAIPSPVPTMGPTGALPAHMQYGVHQFDEQMDVHRKEHMYSLPHNLMPVPNSAGDNNATASKMALPLSVTALFNSASVGGPTASIPGNSGFSTQDAEAQLKAMLFGGYRDSASSSGTASPSSLPPGVQHKVKTVVELEADMHQNSPRKVSSPISVGGGICSPANSRDMTAFNKLLIMINAASEASQNVTQTDPQASRAGLGMVPSHSEFSHAVLRNKEEQIQLLRQSLQIAQQPSQPHQDVLPQIPPPAFHQHHHQMPPPPNQQQPPPLAMHHQAPPVVAYQQLQQAAMNHTKQMANLISKPPGGPNMVAPPPNAVIKPRGQNGGPADPIFNLIHQNPTIVMNPASPSPNMAAILASQQSTVPNTARVPSPLMFSQQPPLHLNAPSPIHPSQLSPRPLTMGGNITSPTGMRSPVLPRVLSPQELSAHAQAVMQGALIKKQLHDQSERFMKKQQERAKSPNSQVMNMTKSQPSVQNVQPPVLQNKGISVNSFTPTSVLRKMHSDKAMEKEKQALDKKGEEETEPISSSHELGGGHSSLTDGNSMEEMSRISFLDPINPNLVTMTNQLENQLRIGQASILSGSLTQPMSVEEKMKLSALAAEKPGYLSQMLDKSTKVMAADVARTIQGRPIVKVQEPAQEDKNMKLHYFTLQQQQPPPPLNPLGRPVTGGSPKIQPSYVSQPPISLAQHGGMQQNKPSTGRAIVGGNSIQQQNQMTAGVPVATTQNIDMLRMLDLQRMQQMPHSQGMVLPPPPLGTPITCLGPPPVTVPVTARIQVPVVSTPVHSVTSAALMHQQIARANAQRNQQISHFMALQQAQQRAPLSPLHTVVSGISAPLSPLGQAAGPLSPAAISATIQRVASPHGGLKMNGPLPTSTINGGAGVRVDMSSGIQRWFSPDILKTQLPSMPPLPTKGNQVMTLDELEGN